MQSGGVGAVCQVQCSMCFARCLEIGNRDDDWEGREDCDDCDD